MAYLQEKDIFDEVVMSEERGQQSGYESGVVDGRRQGELEGRRLGWEKGSAVGSEVGFYAGFAESLLEELRKDQSTKPRVLKTLERIVVVCGDFPFCDPQHPDLQATLEQLRTKFKQVCSQLGIKPESPKSQDVKGVSF